MNQNLPEQDNFEAFIRQELEKTPTDPNPLDWETLANKQSQLNLMIKLRYYAPKTLLVLGLTAAIGWGSLEFFEKRPSPSEVSNLPIAQSAPAVAPVDILGNQPLYNAPLDTDKSGVKSAKNLSTAWAQWVREIPIPMANLTFKAETGAAFTDPKSGSRVTIPAGVLVYADGTPVSGDVDLFYREFRDIPDFLASGIPMHYQDSQGEFFFNSAGMFEVRVEQNQQPVYLKPGQAYNIDFQQTNQLSDVSLYQLDDQKRQWSFVQSALTGTNVMPNPISENTAAIQNANTATVPECMPASVFLPEGIDVHSGIKRAVLAGQRYAKGLEKIPEWFMKYPNGSEKFYLDALERSHIRLNSALDNKTLFFVEDKGKVFSELSAFEDCYFESVGDTLSNQEGKVINLVQEIVRKNPTWKRVEIIPDEEGATGLIYLGQDKEGVKMHFRLCQSQGAALLKKPFDAQTIFKNYLALRQKRRQNDREKILDLILFANTSHLFKPESEWCYDEKEWLKYFLSEKKKMTVRYDALASAEIARDVAASESALLQHRILVREKRFAAAEAAALDRSTSTNLQISLRVSGFGIFNCDQIFRLGTGGELAWIKPNFIDQDQKQIQVAGLYIIDRINKFFIDLPTRDKIAYAPSRELALVVSAVGGKKYYLNYTDYARIKAPAAPMQPVMVKLADAADIQTPKDWATLLDM